MSEDLNQKSAQVAGELGKNIKLPEKKSPLLLILLIILGIVILAGAGYLWWNNKGDNTTSTNSTSSLSSSSSLLSSSTVAVTSSSAASVIANWNTYSRGLGEYNLLFKHPVDFTVTPHDFDGGDLLHYFTIAAPQDYSIASSNVFYQAGCRDCTIEVIGIREWKASGWDSSRDEIVFYQDSNVVFTYTSGTGGGNGSKTPELLDVILPAMISTFSITK